MHVSVRPAPRCAWLLGLVLTAAGLAGATPPPAEAPSSVPSLDALKQDLQELKQNGTTAGSSEILNPIVLPQLHPAAGQGEAPPAPPPERTRTRRQLQQDARNWLLDAMSLMDANRTDRTRSEKRGESADPALPIDPSDPDYLLKVYLAQQPGGPEGRTPAGDSAEDAARKTPPGTGDFDRYLARWLSPGEVKLFDLQTAGPAGTETSAAPPGLRADNELRTTFDADLGPNPYLGNLPTFLAPPEISPPAPAPAAPLLAAPAVTPLPAGGSRTPIKPPPGPEDDKKYFPQLDRF